MRTRTFLGVFGGICGLLGAATAGLSGEAQIKLFPDVERHEVSPFIYGQFIEHIGGGIYDGIWVGEGSEIENTDGIRMDTVRALKAIKVPIVRWPGGLFADNYHWRDGIGPRDQRPVRQNLGWNTTENNHFGTHEFMRFCELIGTEPYLCLNLGCGTVEEARAWAEYCNSDKDTTLTRHRAANGHPEPFAVKFWSLGNEPAYALDGMMVPEHYLDVARTYAGYVKHFASQSVYRGDGRLQSVKIVLGELPRRVFKTEERRAKNVYFDLLSVHTYCNTSHDPDHPAEETYYHLIAQLPKLERRIADLCEASRELSTEKHPVAVAVDEWGIWRHGEANSLNGLVQRAAVADALFTAAFFHVLQKYEKIFMANIAQTINVLHSLILTKEKKFCVTPTYHVFDMFRPHRGGTVIDSTADCEKLQPARNRRQDILSVSATKSRDGEVLFASVVNLDVRDDIQAKIEVVDQNTWKIRSIWRLAGDDIDSQNTFDDPDRVRPKSIDPAETNEKGELTFKAQSITTIRMVKHK